MAVAESCAQCFEASDVTRQFEYTKNPQDPESEIDVERKKGSEQRPEYLSCLGHVLDGVS